ncbi:MAG: L,D-transpeptidase [Nannocystaceae bacterium]|nr:L,D-transpeptidase [bacterium]
MRHAQVLAVLLLLGGCDRHGQAEAPTTGMPQPEDGVAGMVEPPPRIAPPSRVVEATRNRALPPAAPPQPEPLVALTPEAPEHLPVPPPGYGAIAPSDGVPDEASLTVHGLAGYEVVTVYDRPDTSAASLGYLRVGARMMVSPKVAGKGCRGSWHQLPQGGYACVGRGLVVDGKRAPRLNTPATAPDEDSAFPYEYAFVKQWNTPMYWRPPTAKEREAAEKIRAERERARKGEDVPKASPKPEAKPEPPTPDTPKAGLAALPGPDGTTPAAAPAEPVVAEPEPPPPPPEPEVALPLSRETPWLERGFFLAIGEKVEVDGINYWKTGRGGFVEASAAYLYKAKNFEGRVLPDGTSFPMGFVMTPKGAKRYEFNEDGVLVAKETLPNKTFVDLQEEVEHAGKAYMLTTDGGLIRKGVIRFAEPQPLPEGLEPYDRWIDVNLGKQMLVAYQGTEPTFITLVSTGKKGTKEESFETPTGRWRIRSKHVSTTMDGQSDTDGNYSIQDVPWTMYFNDSIALHGAFWHDGFGRVRSHGCVNLGPADAKWLFDWSSPVLPEGWHGVHAHDGSPGTTVVVHE